MQALQRTIQSIFAQLRELTPTAKLLIGSLMIILVMSLFLVSLYAGQRDMVALGLKSTVSAAVKKQVVDYLEIQSIPYEPKGSDILVPEDRKIAVLGQLTEKQLIDGDQINFDSLIVDASPFRTNAENKTRYLVAKMNVLEGMIGQMEGIERAKVVIDPSEGSGSLGRANVPSSASVSVRTSGGELSQQKVDAIAHLVARSHAGLKPENVAIIDVRSGRSMQARDESSVSTGRYLEVKQAAENHVKSAIAGALDFIPGVLIQVNAQVNATDEVQQTSSYEDPKIGVTNESSRTLSSSAPSPVAEPAVRPNTGVNIAMGRNGSQMSDERNDTSSVPAFGRRESQIRDPKGYPLQINATIGVPRSYFVRLMQETKPAASADAGGSPVPADKTAGVDPAELEAFVQKETDRLRLYVTPLIDTQAIQGAAAGTVTVTMVPDFAVPTSDEAQVTPASASMIVGGVSGDLVKSIGLGGLALLSVAMMFLMVRRASGKPSLPTAQELVGVPPALAAADSDLVGEADESAPALEGVELTDDAMRRQQMLDQIRSMISETPEEASSLLRRWVKSEA